MEYIACKDNIRFFHVLSELYIAWNGRDELVMGEEQKLHDQVYLLSLPNLTLRAIQQLNPPEKLEMRTITSAFLQFQTIKHTSSHLGDDAQNGWF